jgi:hypothetical protein
LVVLETGSIRGPYVIGKLKDWTLRTRPGETDDYFEVESYSSDTGVESTAQQYLVTLDNEEEEEEDDDDDDDDDDRKWRSIDGVDVGARVEQAYVGRCLDFKERCGGTEKPRWAARKRL